jgi:2-polyprenyl-3-methyl-5-hydroxy-6-metoxy-1,4-benzoquinol methylase
MTPSADSAEKISCPYCRTVSDFDFPFNTRAYYHCPSCDLIFAKQKEDINTVIAYYQNLYFDDYTEDQMSGQRTNIYRHILDLLDGYKKHGSLLDLGCGCGFFLKEAGERGWQVTGVDPSQKSIAYARSLVGDTVICGTLDDVPTDRRFDAITLINVLDHMVDACRQLQKVHDLLAPEGILYLRFPNGSFHSFVMRLSLMLSAKQFMNRFLIFHEYAITPKAIKRCLGDMGFGDIRVFNAYLTGGNFFPAGWTFAKLTMKILSSLTWGFFKALEKLSGGRWVWGPSLQVSCRSKITVTLKCSDQHKEP